MHPIVFPAAVAAAAVMLAACEPATDPATPETDPAVETTPAGEAPEASAGAGGASTAGDGHDHAHEMDADADDEPVASTSKPRVISLDQDDLKEVVADQVYMKHFFGDTFSLAYFWFPPGSEALGATSLHTHGEEFAINLRGRGDLASSHGVLPLEEGDVYLIPPHLAHGGSGENPNNPEGTIILGIVTPPRAEYGPEGETGYYPSAADAPAGDATAAHDGETPGAPRKLFNLSDIPWQERVPGQVYMNFWHGESVSIGIFRMQRKDGEHIPIQRNRHGEEIAIALSGRFDMEVEGGKYSFGEGEAFVIPAWQWHSGECLDEACVLLSWFNPGRRDEWGEEGQEPELRFMAEPAQ